MPARKRKKPGGVEPQPDLSTRGGRKVAQSSAAEVFAERQKAERRRQSEEAKARREAQQREERRRELNRAKDRAAERLKEVRRRDLPGAVRAEADAAYRAALDAVLRDEQGLPPLDEVADDDTIGPTPPVADDTRGQTDPVADDADAAEG